MIIDKKILFLMGFLLVAAGIFEFLPAIHGARSYVSLENYQNLKTSCQKLLDNRPWYGKTNHWFFVWLLLTPALVFSVVPHASAWMRGGVLILAIASGYALINMAVHLQWDIRNAPFQEDPFHPDPLNGWRMDCANYAGDGFSYMIAFYKAWIPSFIYTGFCLLIWRFYHRRFSKKMTKDYKNDVTAQIVFWGTMTYFLLVALFILVIAANVLNYSMYGEMLYQPGFLSTPYYHIIRPSLIPLEIFMY